MSSPTAMGRTRSLLGRLGRLLWGLEALLVLLALVGGVPVTLWMYVGWPLPHALPTLAELGRALTQNGIPDTILIDILALGCWAAWAVFAASIVAETAAAVRGRSARRVPMAGPLQALAGSLVAAVLLAFLPMAPRAHAQLLPGGPLPAALAAVEPTALAHPDPGSSRPIPAGRLSAATHRPDTKAAPAPAVPRRYTVKPRDTLWGIAERELGDPLRWHDVYRRNKDRPQPDGGALTDPDLIRPGWILELPAGSSPSQPGAARTPAPTAGPASQPPRTAADRNRQASQPVPPTRRLSCRPGPWWGCRLPAGSPSRSPPPASTSADGGAWASHDRASPTPTPWSLQPCSVCAAPHAPAASQTPPTTPQSEPRITSRIWTGPGARIPRSASPHPQRPRRRPLVRWRRRRGLGSWRSGSTTIRK